MREGEREKKVRQKSNEAERESEDEQLEKGKGIRDRITRTHAGTVVAPRPLLLMKGAHVAVGACVASQ